MDPSSPNKFKGKFPAPIERFIQRIQNYFSVYNPPEYLNDLRPGINNSEDEGYQLESSNNTQIILPCNGTSTIVIIPVPLENDNVSSNQNAYPNKPDTYVMAPTTSKPNCSEDITTTSPKCPEITTPKPNCPEVTTPKPNCAEVTTPKPKCPEVTTPKPNCPEVTTPRPKCPEATTPKPNCPEVTTLKPNCLEVTTPKPNCVEVTTPKPNCPEVTTPKPNCPEASTPQSKCPEATTQKPHCPPKQSSTASNHKPISGYGPTEAPSLNLVAQSALGSTVLYFYKQPTTLPPYNPPVYNPPVPAYYIPNTQLNYEDTTRRPKPPILRLKQLLFPRLYAAFHPDE